MSWQEWEISGGGTSTTTHRVLIPGAKSGYPIQARFAYRSAHDSSNTNQTIDLDARREGFFTAEIVNTKRHVNFNLPKPSFKPEKETLPGNEANAEEKRDNEVGDGGRQGWRDEKRKGRKGERKRIVGISWT